MSRSEDYKSAHRALRDSFRDVRKRYAFSFSEALLVLNTAVKEETHSLAMHLFAMESADVMAAEHNRRHGPDGDCGR